MQQPLPSPYPSFEALYAAEHPRVIGWLRTRGADDPEGIAHDVFVDLFRSCGHRPETWTKAYLYTAARNALGRHWRDARLAVTVSLDEPLAGTEDLGRGELLAASAAPLTPAEAAARYIRMRQELARMPAKMRVAFALPSIFELSNKQTAAVLELSVTRVDHLRVEALERIYPVFGARPQRLVVPLYRPLPDVDRVDAALAATRPPKCHADGSLSVKLQPPDRLETPPPCMAIVHVAPGPDDERVPVSDPTPVHWETDTNGLWIARLAPHFPTKVAPRATLLALYLFEGDWLAGA
ncbi:MAG: sigma-70 family RNA polymerase sigma factor [Planctomycetes bacterium]|nr:sigma-70 family RNA polymerase sigma factor [Planctomycetota bacterium]